MDSLLDALQEGRLIELPDNDKFHSLQFLAHIIEAIPSVPPGTDVAGLVLAREQNTNTSISRGFACPHARVPYDEDLTCSIGWSPTGIDYGASDGLPVHIVIMYLVPDNQRNQFLKEISLIAKALSLVKDIQPLTSMPDLNSTRNYLLDLLSSSRGVVSAEARAKMIQLEVKETLVAGKMPRLSDVIIEPMQVVSGYRLRHIVLSQSKELNELLENSSQLIDALANTGLYELNGWRIIKRNAMDYQSNRTVYDCIAIRSTK